MLIEIEMRKIKKYKKERKRERGKSSYSLGLSSIYWSP